MSQNRRNIGVIILAAGQGSRMKSPLPKVMHPLRGKPLVERVVANVEASGCCDRPVVVVCKDHTMVQDQLGDRAVYAVQEEQLGTGHAVLSAERLLKDAVDHVVVLYGDMPFLTGASISRLVEKHMERGDTVTIMTATVPHFEGRYAPFRSFGRVIRSAGGGHIERLVEKKDATEKELEIFEVNPVYACFRSEWLWRELRNLDNRNAQREYYLTDVVNRAVEEGEKISSIDVSPTEAIGVNTKEDLAVAETFIHHS